VASGENNTGRTACWLDFSDDNTFFVSNAIEAGIASYSFNNGVKVGLTFGFLMMDSTYTNVMG